MSVRSASRGSPAAKSIRLALRTSSIVETRSASFVRWVLRCFGRRCLSSEPTLSAIFLMPFIMCFQGPPGVEPLNHTPLPHVNSLASKLMDGKDTVVGAIGLAHKISLRRKFILARLSPRFGVWDIYYSFTHFTYTW